jgi:hypothetical protein
MEHSSWAKPGREPEGTGNGRMARSSPRMHDDEAVFLSVPMPTDDQPVSSPKVFLRPNALCFVVLRTPSSSPSRFRRLLH